MPEVLSMRVKPITVQVGDRVTLEPETGDDLIVEVVRERPAEDVAPDIEVLVRFVTLQSPIGRAIMGRSVGDEVTYETPRGPVGAKIKKIERGVSNGRPEK